MTSKGHKMTKEKYHKKAQKKKVHKTITTRHKTLTKGYKTMTKIRYTTSHVHKTIITRHETPTKRHKTSIETQTTTKGHNIVTKKGTQNRHRETQNIEEGTRNYHNSTQKT